MHICFLCHEYPPGHYGGLGSFTQTIARALVRRGHRVSVVGHYPPARVGVEDDQGVRVIRFPRSTLPAAGMLVTARRLSRELRRLHAEAPLDAVQGPELSMAGIPRSFPAPTIIRMNGGHHFFSVTLGKRPRRGRGWVERRSLARADYLTAVSRYVGETTRQLVRLGTRPIERMPTPVNTECFRPRPEIPEEEGLIFFLGTVCEKKGIRQLVQAMPAITAAVPEARLLVVGRDQHEPVVGGSFTEYLRGQVPAGLRERVVFAGPKERSELPELVARASICAYPSHMEALPNTWLEAMAMGKALVGSRTGPGPELVEDGVHGLLCDPYDPASVAEPVIRLLKDPDLRRRLGAAARRRIVDDYSIERIVERNEAFYQRCAKERSSG